MKRKNLRLLKKGWKKKSFETMCLKQYPFFPFNWGCNLSRDT